MTSTARDEVLARVRSALGTVGDSPPAVVRNYRRTSAAPAGSPELLTVFAERVADYRASIVTCAADDGSIAAAVSSALTAHSAGSVVGPTGVRAWLPTVGRTFDSPTLSIADLDQIDAVVTGCAVAIAETGTIVLDGGPTSGRRVISLVPDVHVCVVRADQVVGNVPEALTRLDPARPLTFVSGPSATSDIELDRVEGVHGPRTLHVVLAV